MSEKNTQTMELVRFDRVGLRYADAWILNNLSFSLKLGSFHFLTGISGAGKTSLLKLIYRGLIPNQDTVRVFGKDVCRITENEIHIFRQKIGIVMQDCRLLNHLNVTDNVAIALTVAGTRVDVARAQAAELLQWAGLGDHLLDNPATLSDGQKQRVAIARAVITRPLILIADEPTGHLDQEAAYRLVRLFQELNSIGTTILFATHNQTLVETFPYPELHLHKGCIVANKITPSNPGVAQYA